MQIQSGRKIFVIGTVDLKNTTIEIFNAQKNIPLPILTAEKIIDNMKLSITA